MIGIRKLLVGCCLAVVVPGLSNDGLAADEHRFTRSPAEIDVPDVTLIDQTGQTVRLRDALLADEPVYVEFIFATCTTVCPVLSAGYASMQRKLGDLRDQVRLVSITIDPEHDGPEELHEYLQRYGARPGWDFLTGTRADIEAVMRAFDAYVADKMSHRPLTFVRAPATGQWVRIDGFAGSADLLEELRRASGE